jgi:transcriptional regulator with XRE-family HTH domain
MTERISKRKMQRPLKSRTVIATHLLRIRTDLQAALGDDKWTQKELARELRVEQSTVAKWENAAKRGTHEPSAEILIKFAALLAPLGERFEGDCIWLLKLVGVASNDAILSMLERRLSRQIEPRPANPGEINKVPLIEVSTEETAIGGRGGTGTYDVPAWLAPDPASIICARISWGLFPFMSGVVVLDRWAGDIWDLIEQGALVAVHFTRYQARLGLDLSPEEVQQMLTEAEPVGEKWDLVSRRHLEALHAGPEEQKAFDAQLAFESKLSKRWTPDERGTVRLDVIQAGWAGLELAEHPDFAIHHYPRAKWPQPDGGPWRLVLQAASVGRGRGLAVPLTGWNKSNWQARPPVRLVDSMILGRVTSWMSPTPAHEAPPIRTKSRKEPK